MITKDLKISMMLKAYPQTLEILVDSSPHFKKLKNPILRKALSGRVNVEQAAGIANVDVNILITKLNNSIGKFPEKISLGNKGDKKSVMKNQNMENTYNKKIDQSKVVQFDVRPIINSGKDPLKFILAKVKELKEDEVLLLINSFEPIPLYTVLGNKGYTHKTEKEDDVFKIYFYNDSNIMAVEEEIKSHNNKEINITDFENIIEIDVRDLEPPEPMIKVLETLSKIDDKTALLMHHHREPIMLYPKLEERGYRAFCTKINENYFKIVIIKKKG